MSDAAGWRNGSPAAPIDLDTPTQRGNVIAATLCLGIGLVGYFLVVPGVVYVPSKIAGAVNSPAFLPNVLFILLAGRGAIYLFGMTLASALCVAATMYYFGDRRPWIIGPIAIILPALLW